MGRRKQTPSNSRLRSREPANSNQQPGLVIMHTGRDLVVEDKQGQQYLCSARKRLGRIVCGDRVRWQVSGPGQGIVTQLEPRSSLLARPDARGEQRPLAANLDQLAIVCAPEPPLSESLIDRYLVCAELIGVRALLLVNKCDLMAATLIAQLEQRLALYRELGYALLFTSTRDTTQPERLSQHFNNHTSIMVGQSGVGKSSLVQCLRPDVEIRVGGLSDSSGLGKHTTSTTRLYHLHGGGNLIDSPGVRDFQLGPISSDQVQLGFRELQRFRGQCRFHNCRHQGEPGCAVEAAVQAGVIDARRMANYRILLQQALEHEKSRYSS